MKKISSFVCLLLFSLPSTASLAQDVKTFPIFDAHIHYSHDAWQAFPPKDAIRRLKAIGIKQALVSSTSDEGTQKLYQADPSFVIPSLRPYRKRGTLQTWMHDETVIPYLKQRLAKFRYAAIGELHIDGEQARLPVIKEIIGLAKKHNLILHVHSDARAIELIFEQYPGARILWAHAGFEYARVVGGLMDKHNKLWADLSFRHEISNNGLFLPGWKALLVKHADRFYLGIDTYIPQRWLQIKNVMQWQRDLLAALPKDVAQKIAYKNGERIARIFKNNK